MNRSSLKVLHLEDSAADAEQVQRELDRMSVPVSTQRVDTPDAFEQALREFEPHVVLSDHSLARFNSIAALKLVQARRPTAAFIILSGALDPHDIVTSLRAGAEDVVLKDDLSRLRPAVEAAMSVRELLEKLSPRQLQVLRLVADGHTTPAIAERLNLSGKTVETHRGEVMKRLGIHDLARLVRYAVRVGLVSPEN
ncbi:MAG: response regulator transcription factor [bacterium]